MGQATDGYRRGKGRRAWKKKGPGCAGLSPKLSFNKKFGQWQNPEGGKKGSDAVAAGVQLRPNAGHTGWVATGKFRWGGGKLPS